MMEVKLYIYLPEVVPQHALQEWKAKIKLRQSVLHNCPDEVRQFIAAIANKLGDFGRFREYQVMRSGRELLLCMKEWQGQKIDPWAMYPVNVPVLMAVDNQTAMLRIFQKRGKQGLIDFCKAKVSGTELERVLEILNVHVFHLHRPEYKKVMSDIEKSKKLEAL